MNILSILTVNISPEVYNGFVTGAVSVQEISLIAIVIGAIFVNNVVLSQFLGICPFLGVSSKVNTSLGMGMAVTFVMALSSIVTWCLQTYILVPFGIMILTVFKIGCSYKKFKLKYTFPRELSFKSEGMKKSR